MKKKAILYTSNFEKLATLAQYLVHDDWEIISAGETARFLKENNIPFQVAKPLLSNANSDDSFISILHMILASGRNLLESSLYTEDVINLVCMNLEPKFKKINEFKEVNKTENCINLQHVTLIRAAAKNYMNVVVLTDPADYQETIIQLKTESMSSDYRLYLAGKALSLCAAYDSADANSITSVMAPHEFPSYFLMPFKFAGKLSHGLNEHQEAALYSLNDQLGALSGMKKIQGKEMNTGIYANCYAAWRAVSIFTRVLKTSLSFESKDHNGYPFLTQLSPAAGSVFSIAVKNLNPVGSALGSNLIESFRKNYSCDPASFKGSVFGCSCVIDEEAALQLMNCDFMAIIAPDFTKEAKAVFASNKDLRLVIASKQADSKYDLSFMDGGLLVSRPDKMIQKNLRVVTQLRPTRPQVYAMAFGMLVAMVSKSDCAVVVNNTAAVGISAGNTTRSRAVRYALMEAKEYFEKNNLTSEERNAEILVSDSAIEFDEHAKTMADAGIKAVIQTGGSETDEEFIQYCNEHGIAMVFTGIQHLAI